MPVSTPGNNPEGKSVNEAGSLTLNEQKIIMDSNTETYVNRINEDWWE